MTDEREIARRASEARRLLDEPLLNEALDRIEHQATEELLKCDRHDDEGRRLMADYVRVVRSIRSQLKAVISNSELTLRPKTKVV